VFNFYSARPPNPTPEIFNELLQCDRQTAIYA
jgi:hypothetical protein